MPGLSGIVRRGGSVLAALGLLALPLALSAPTASAQTTDCRVSILSHRDTSTQPRIFPSWWWSLPGTRATSSAYTDLQSAVDAANSEDTLLIQGTCRGTTTISKDLTLTGITSVGLFGSEGTTNDDSATLNGNRQGTVLTTSGEPTVTINNLLITGGSGASGGGIFVNSGTVIVNSSLIRGNDANTGGGVFVNFGAFVVNSSRISGNVAVNGGGILNAGGTTILTNSIVNDNTATNFGGGIYNEFGITMTLNGTTNVSDNGAHVGGGIYLEEGPLTLNEGSSISDNRASGAGGGIFELFTTVTLNDRSSIRDNRAGTDGGGIDSRAGTVIMNETTSISSNHANNDGGGINIESDGGAVTMNQSSSIRYNRANDDGGGIFNDGGAGTLSNCIDGFNVFDNWPNNLAS